jgi:hypothetical protein
MGTKIASPPSTARNDTKNQVSLMLATEHFDRVIQKSARETLAL